MSEMYKYNFLSCIKKCARIQFLFYFSRLGAFQWALYTSAVVCDTDLTLMSTGARLYFNFLCLCWQVQAALSIEVPVYIKPRLFTFLRQKYRNTSARFRGSSESSVNVQHGL